MKTPIVSFLKSYQEKSPVRMHMPGHKGAGILGFEEMDLTEIHGADELFAAEGIIKESEQNASSLFGCPTYYSRKAQHYVFKQCAQYYVRMPKVKVKILRFLQEEMPIEALFMQLHYWILTLNGYMGTVIIYLAR